jgi:predicted lipid-binding transport protein (Tim44 family)
LKIDTNASIAPKTPGRPKKAGKASTQPSRTSSRLRRQQASASPAPAVPAPPAAAPAVTAPAATAPVINPADENEDKDEDVDVDA